METHPWICLRGYLQKRLIEEWNSVLNTGGIFSKKAELHIPTPENKLELLHALASTAYDQS